MTTEHVSVPREELEELVSRFRKRAKQWADFGKYAGEAEATQCADDLQAILSRATPIDVCYACEGRPGPANDPCAVCGKSAKPSTPRATPSDERHVVQTDGPAKGLTVAEFQAQFDDGDEE